MLRYYFFTLFFFFLMVNNASAQCPGCVITLPDNLGEDTVYLSTPITGQVGVYYDDDLSFRLPKTTANVDPTINPPLNITNIEITAVTNVPPGLQYQANQTSFPVQQETDGCVKFCGTPLTADSFYVQVTVEAQVSIITQTTAFLIPFLIEPATTTTEGFTMNNNVGCGEAEVTFNNNIPAVDSVGFSYYWDFGNGMTSTDENPESVIYDSPGTYDILYEAVIDTTGYFLTQVSLDASDCTDLIGTADFFLQIRDPAGNLVYVSPTLSANPPLTFDIPSLMLGGGDYTITVYDDDPFTNVNCGTVSLNFSTEGQLSSGSLALTPQIIHPVQMVSSTGTVTVYALPDSPAISPTEVPDLCNGEVTILEVPSYDNITWYQDTTLLLMETSNTLEVTETGNYYAIYTNAEGCQSVSDTVSVNFLDIPNSPTFVYNENELSIIYTNLLPDDYNLQWYVNGTAIEEATDTLICMEMSGDYSLVVTDNETGCINSYQQYQVFIPNVGCAETAVNDIAAEPLNIYPNPTKDFIQISASGLTQGLVEIYALNGELLIQLDRFYLQNNSIDVSGLSQGFYLLKVSHDGKIYRERFVKL